MGLVPCREGERAPGLLWQVDATGSSATEAQHPALLLHPWELLSSPQPSPFAPWSLQISSGEAYLVYTERLYSKSEFNNYLAALYKVVGTFLFGGAISQSLTDLAKYMIGRLRPNFLAVCNPDWSKVNCSIYVQLENVCQGESRNITESR